MSKRRRNQPTHPTPNGNAATERSTSRARFPRLRLPSVPPRSIVMAILAVAGIAALLTPILMFWGGPLGVWFASFSVRSGLMTLAFLGAVASVPLFLTSERRGVHVAAVLLFITTAGVLLYGLTPLWGASQTVRYQDDITATADPLPAFEERTPFVQAKTLLNRNRGGVQVGDGETNPTFLGDGKWSILLDGSGTGLKASGVVVWDGKGEGSANFTRCQYAAPTSALRGALWNSLMRELKFAAGFGPYSINTNDAYGFCDENNAAVMVVPVTEFSGFAPSRQVFGGVLVVRSSEDIEFVRNVEPGALPGPVYPESLVMAVEAANPGRDGSVGDVVFVRSNYLVVDGEDGSPNSRNSGQFMLTGSDGNLYAVSPMNRAKGSGSEIVAVAVTPVSYGTAGGVNPLTIHELPSPRQANAEVGNFVRSEFSSLNWFAGLGVMEITPLGPDEWVGYIGRDVSPEHRFTVTADRRICVTDIPSGRARGCSGESGDDEGGTGGGTVLAPDVPQSIDGLSPQELIALRDAVDAELDRLALRGAAAAGE